MRAVLEGGPVNGYVVDLGECGGTHKIVIAPDHDYDRTSEWVMVYRYAEDATDGDTIIRSTN